MPLDDPSPAITKRAFTCPHCLAFAGQNWSRALLANFRGSGLPYPPDKTLALVTTVPVPEPYRAYASEMARDQLPFVGHQRETWGGLELFNAAFSSCNACSKIAYWVGSVMVYPAELERAPAPPEVPAHLAADYNEAADVLSRSAKASAALSRRCLQSMLRDQGYNQKDLAPAIEALLAARVLPSGLASNVDSIRNVGNFAAHPQKDTNSGALIDVEPHEAEWNLEVLEGLFDFFYVGPAKDAQRLAAYNAKLAQAGKPPMK